MITCVSLVTVYCLDQTATRDFYVDTLGFEPGTDITGRWPAAVRGSASWPDDFRRRRGSEPSTASCPRKIESMTSESIATQAKPKVVDAASWRSALADLRRREKAATRELDAIAAARRRLPMVEMPEYTLTGPDGPVSLADAFEGRAQLIVYNHMWDDGAEWQCPGCTGFTSQFTRLDFLDNYDARFVVVTSGPIDEALAYRDKVGNTMAWYSCAGTSFGADVDAAPGEGFGVNVFLRDGDTVYRTWHTNGRGTEQLGHLFGLLDVLPWGRQEEWLDSPDGWPSRPTYSGWSDSPDIARLYGRAD